MNATCHVMTCDSRPRGLVRLNVLDGGRAATREVAMCTPCSDAVEAGIDRGRRPAITPAGAIYFDDLWELRRPKS